MKLGFLSVVFFFVVCAAGAQSAPENALLIAAPNASFSHSFTYPIYSAFADNALLAALPAAAAPAPAPAPQQVQGVFPITYWQASFGYSYMRFYQLPNTAVNTNGFDLSMAYFFKPWLAGEGEISGGLGSQIGERAKSVFSGAGLRARRAGPRATELWIHGVAGVAHFEPKTTFGGENALGFELGGGIDLNTRRERMAYRLEADFIETSFFGTYQVSPKLAAGVVYKF